MSVIQQIAFYQNRRDEVPNVELAHKLAKNQDRSGIQEIAENLWNENPRIQADCLKVIYEVGARRPDLIEDYFDDFIKLTSHRNNRLVWGSMIALAYIAHLRANDIFAHRAGIEKLVETGSVITKDYGVRILSSVASQAEEYHREILPFLFRQLSTCRPKDVPQHAETMFAAIQPDSWGEFSLLLESRLPDLNPSQLKRIQKIMRTIERDSSGDG